MTRRGLALAVTAIAVFSSRAAGQIVPVTQNRTISGFAQTWDGTNPYSLAAPDFGPFNVMHDINMSGPGGSFATAHLEQNSTILSTGIHMFGGAAGNTVQIP